MLLNTLTTLMLFGAGASAAPFDKRTPQAEVPRFGPPAEDLFTTRPFFNNMPFITYDKRDALLPFPQFQGDPFTIEEKKRAIPHEEARNVQFGPYGPESLNYVPRGYPFPNTMPRVNRGGRSGIRPLPVTIPEKRQVGPLPGRFIPPGSSRDEPLRLTGFGSVYNRLLSAGQQKRDEAMKKAKAAEARIAETFPGYRPRVPPPKNGIELAVCGLYIGRC